MLFLIVTSLLALMITGMATYLMLPVMENIYDSDATDELNPTGRASADNLYNVYAIMPLLFVGGIFLSLYMRAARKQSDEAFA